MVTKELTMVVRFEATVDDVVDVSIRTWSHSKARRSWRLQGVVMTAVILGGLAYLLLRQDIVIRLTIAFVIAALGAAFYLATYEDSYRKRARKLVREQMAGDSRLEVTVELLDKGLVFNQRGTTVIQEWSRIDRVEEADDALYFYGQGGICSAVRKRAFESQAMKDEFLKRANEYIQKSRGSNCSTS